MPSSDFNRADPGLRYRWTGREYDKETGFYYFRARYYDPGAKRFIQEDPIGYGGGANLYAYVDGQPLEARDPSGMLMDYNAPGVTNENWSDPENWLTALYGAQYTAGGTMGSYGSRMYGGNMSSYAATVSSYNSWSAEKARRQAVAAERARQQMIASALGNFEPGPVDRYGQPIAVLHLTPVSFTTQAAGPLELFAVAAYAPELRSRSDAGTELRIYRRVSQPLEGYAMVLPSTGFGFEHRFLFSGTIASQLHGELPVSGILYTVGWSGVYYGLVGSKGAPFTGIPTFH